MAEQKKQTNSKNNTAKNKKVANKNNNVANKKTNTNKVASKKNSSVKKDSVKKVTPLEEVKEEKVIEEKVIAKPKKEKKEFKLTSTQRDILLIILAVVVLGIALVLTTTKKFSIELPVVLEGTPGFNEITYAEYEEKLATEAPFLVIIVRDGCGYCEMYEPIVEEVAKEYNLPINYINLTNINSEEKALLSKSNLYLRRNQWGTPTTLFMYGENVVDSIGGYVDKESFVAFVKENFVVEQNEQ